MLGMRAHILRFHQHVYCSNTLRIDHAQSEAFHTSPHPLSQPSDSAPSSLIDDYYSLLLSQPLSSSAQATRTPPAVPVTPPPKLEEVSTTQKARIVFGSRLAGPAERQRNKDSQSSLIAGVLVPPRPTEPDNCCMSGCVNCVWETYRDDMEEWVQKKAEAKRRELMGKGQEGGRSMDDDGGGGSDANWTEADYGGNDAGLFEGVPVGIREFMRTEKRLKEKARLRASQ